MGRFYFKVSGPVEFANPPLINADIAAELGLEGKPELINVGVLNNGCEQFETQPVNFF